MPIPKSAMLAGSGTVADVEPAGGAASVKADVTENDPTEPPRFRLAITLEFDGSKAARPPAGVNVPRKSAVTDSLPVGVTDWSVF